jgi:hypothetical protein
MCKGQLFIADYDDERNTLIGQSGDVFAESGQSTQTGIVSYTQLTRPQAIPNANEHHSFLFLEIFGYIRACGGS